MARKRSTAGWAALAAAVVLGLAFPAAAETLYKLIDRNGKVTYSNEEPKEFDGKVIRMDVDPNANKASLGVPPTDAGESHDRAKAKGAARETAKAQNHAERVQAAQEKLDAAREAYEQARDHPTEGVDVRYVGNVKGGTRAVPSEDYQKRLDRLEHAVKEAEDELREATAGH